MDFGASSEIGASPRLQGICLGLGVLTAAAGSWWIFATHETRPVYSFCYHVPLAFVAGCWAAHVLLATRAQRRTRLVVASLLGLGLVAARIALDWPLSGHGVLAGLIATATPWTWLRAAAAVVLAQALATKWVEDTAPMTVVWGAAAGCALALLALRRRGQRPE